jgi:hypothetical protein
MYLKYFWYELLMLDASEERECIDFMEDNEDGSYKYTFQYTEV